MLHLHPDEVVPGPGHGAVRPRIDRPDRAAYHRAAGDQFPLGRIPDLRRLPVRQLEARPVVELRGIEPLAGPGRLGAGVPGAAGQQHAGRGGNGGDERGDLH